MLARTRLWRRLVFQNYWPARCTRSFLAGDGHGADRSGRVRQDLQSRRHCDPHESRAAPPMSSRTTVYRTAEEKYEAVVNGMILEDNSKGQRHPPVARDGPAGPGGDDPRSRNPSICRACSKRCVGDSTSTCSTRNSTSARRTSSRGSRTQVVPVTVSTNMAGRGTDILLGGNPEAMTRRLLHVRERLGDSLTLPPRR